MFSLVCINPIEPIAYKFYALLQQLRRQLLQRLRRCTTSISGIFLATLLRLVATVVVVEVLPVSRNQFRQINLVIISLRHSRIACVLHSGS